MADENRWRDGDQPYRRWEDDRDRWRAERGDNYRNYGRDYYGSYGAWDRGLYGPYGWGPGVSGYGSYGPYPGYGGYPGYGEHPGYGASYGYGRGREDRGWWDRASDEVASWFGDDDAERRRRMDEARAGQHRGRGPRGYQRSADRIREDVNDRLTDDPWLDATGIDVSVDNSEVTLGGTVHSRTDKRRAEDLAERVLGVSHVQNNLRVQQLGTDVAVERAAGERGAAATGSQRRK